jgi:hypothetical protein
MTYRETQIDEAFPVPGVDNESQGFRDNFSAIKDTLIQAKIDIEGLQESRLDISSPETDLGGNTIKNANLAANTYAFDEGAGISASQIISYTAGSFHYLGLIGGTSGSPAQLVLSDIPSPTTPVVTVFRVAVRGDGTERFFAFNTETTGAFYVDNSWPATLSVTSATGAKMFEFWTYDGGNTVFAKYLGQFALLD